MVMSFQDREVSSPYALDQDGKLPETPVKIQFELLKKAGIYEVLGNLFSCCGGQSNILVSAKYAHQTKSLTKARIYQAVAKVIDDHPALSIIGVTQPSNINKGNHRLWEARLPTINLEDCITFITERPENDIDLARIYERCHNQWFNTEDKTKPWWRVLVVNSTWLLFIYHHNIGDGTSGYAFHQSFLAALNEERSDLKENLAEEGPIIIKSSSKLLQPTATEDSTTKISWLYLLRNYLLPNNMRLFMKRKHSIFSDAIQPESAPKLDDCFRELDATVTQVQILRFEQALMKKCLSACRENNTSFTALLHTLIQITLAIDSYPRAKSSFSRLAVSVRPFLRSRPGNDVFTNAASIYYFPCRMREFRAAGSSSCLHNDKIEPAISRYQVSASQVWKLTTEYKEGLSKFASVEGHALQSFMSGKFLGEDDEDVMRRYQMGLFQGNSFVISNLGMFRFASRGHDSKDVEWIVEDVGFSAAAIKVGLCDFPLALNVVSLKDGDCIITASFQKGVLGEKMVSGLLEGLRGRLENLLDY